MNTVFPELKQCSGCTACYSSCPTDAISMKKDDEGFLYPVIDPEKCINCNKCRKVCPFNNPIEKREFNSKIYAFTHSDTAVLANSTSGGAFTAISDGVLKDKGVVFGAVYTPELAVCHVGANTKAQRDKMCGSKYLQSNIGQSFKEIKTSLETGKTVLFSGTPCQVAGLKSYLSGNKTPGALITVDFLCHGVMSPLLFEDYIRFVEKKTKKKIIAHDCRKKFYGWGHCESNVFSDESEDHKSRFSQLHKRLFYMDVGERPSCYNCKFCSIERYSDITIGDFWGIEKYDKEMFDKNGVSLIIVNSLQGEKVLKSILPTGRIREESIQYVLPKQPHLSTPIKMTDERIQFWSNYKKRGYYYAIKKLFYRPLHELISDVLKSIRIYDFLLKMTGKT